MREGHRVGAIGRLQASQDETAVRPARDAASASAQGDTKCVQKRTGAELETPSRLSYCQRMQDFSTWTKRETPGLKALEGGHVLLEPLNWTKHGEGLFTAVGGDANAGIWEWMPVGPFPDRESLRDFLALMHDTDGWKTLVILDRQSGAVLGMATFMRIREAHGSAEIGCVAFGPKLRRTRHATEAQALMASHLFDELGYRRYEWKCNVENTASKRAAERFGYAFEGVFRNDMVTKGRSRDTAWYSITGAEWPALKVALDQWLADANFATDGAQIRTLESFRR
jgi:RimJ/RimL family protein N-acetyltransferase